jgi:hypothetical protein
MADEVCKNNRGRFGCHNVVTDGGVNDSGYCENCYTPETAEKNAEYERYLVEGHSHTEAALLSGLEEVQHVQVLGGEIAPDNVIAETGTEFEVPARRYGSTPITTPEQDAAELRDHSDDDDDEGDDEEALEDAGTCRLLDEIEEENDRPEIA